MQQAQPYGRQDDAFRRLVAERNRFTVSMTVLFLVLYFLLPVLAGYNKPLMASKVFGNVTFGYVMAFMEFVMGWVMAAVYMVRVRGFDRLAAQASANAGARA
ncbi:DUF485 domain-containing protein [Deinococcus aquiradiocola]|uniref:DUF485 domain-containing protein n=1 Tax=Deinococcus aquiradiocola TaxID=393059 RepID=A0A917PFM1_9DEIO|nr:DUF485 domain-containing protein [Deinococcus aquiradiocola]GGJ74972.1 hypothetical protein GCM10008939_19090 [Deinococcus aquiradiocola]